MLIFGLLILFVGYDRAEASYAYGELDRTGFTIPFTHFAMSETMKMFDNDQNTFMVFTTPNPTYRNVNIRFNSSVTLFNVFYEGSAMHQEYMSLDFHDSSGKQIGAITLAPPFDMDNVKAFPPVENVREVRMWYYSTSYPLTIRELDFNVVDDQPPDVPTGFTATSDTQQVKLSWNPVTSTKFYVYYIYKNGVKIGESFSSNFIVTGLTPDVPNQFQVSAVSYMLNESEKTSPITAIAYKPPVPPVLSGDPDTYDVLLTWTDVHASRYDVFKNAAYLASTMGTRYLVTGLSSKTSYTFRVDAFDEYERLVPSNLLDVETLPEWLSYPGNIRASPMIGSIKVDWDAIVSPYIKGYYVYVDDMLVTPYPLTTTSYTFTSPPDQYRSIRIRTVDDYDRLSVLSVPVVTASWAELVNPTLQLTSVMPKEVGLQWNQVGTTYKVYRQSSSGTQLIATTTQTLFSATGLQPDTDYTFYVESVDKYGRQIRSQDVSVHTPTPPPPVKPILTVSDLKFDSFQVNWGAAAGTSYDVYLDDTKIASSVVQPKYVVDRLAPLTVYKVKVISKDLYGQSAESDEVTVTTMGLPDPIKPKLQYLVLTHNSVRLNWNDTGKPYEIYKGDDLITTQNTLFYQVKDLQPETDYVFKVVSTDQFGRKVDSDLLAIKTLAAPTPKPSPSPTGAPPAISHSNNPQLNRANDYLVQGAKDQKSSFLSMTTVITAIILLVFATIWLILRFKKKMRQASTPTSTGTTPKQEPKLDKNQKAVRVIAMKKYGYSKDKATQVGLTIVSPKSQATGHKRRSKYYVQRNRKPH